jgi:2-polyprenyl-3-methyl-5-hydroxy-6-metoxy-1,4-benzoquinol methylase
MTIRWRICPLRTIAVLAPKRGVIVDLGCGHGLFAQLLARQAPSRTVIGIDLDTRKIALAQQLKLPNLRFVAGDVAEADLPPAEAVTILDVFYLVPYDIQERLLVACAAKLTPDGVIVLKEMAEKPRWKVWLNWLRKYWQSGCCASPKATVQVGFTSARGRSGMCYSRGWASPWKRSRWIEATTIHISSSSPGSRPHEQEK